MPELPRVMVERELCLGADYCTRIALGTFELGADGVAVVVDSEASTDEQLRQAADTCPAGAIFLAERP